MYAKQKQTLRNLASFINQLNRINRIKNVRKCKRAAEDQNVYQCTATQALV